MLRWLQLLIEEVCQSEVTENSGMLLVSSSLWELGSQSDFPDSQKSKTCFGAPEEKRHGGVPSRGDRRGNEMKGNGMEG